MHEAWKKLSTYSQAGTAVHHNSQLRSRPDVQQPMHLQELEAQSRAGVITPLVRLPQ